jgi:dsRNA-specific ribonuclease
MNTMTAKGTIAVQDNLVKVLEKLEAARKMQDGWMNRGLDFVDLYVEDAGGDWLEKWGKAESLEFDTIRSVDVDAVKAAIGDRNFQNVKLLEIALSRGDTNNCRGGSFESPVGQNAEHQRLSLLGSAIFGAVVTDYLYRKYPHLDRDSISTIKSGLADKKKLSEFAIDLKVTATTGRGANDKKTDKSESQRFLGETFNAIFGAIYLTGDRDFGRAGEWLIQHFIEPAVSQNIDIIEPPEISAKTAVKRRGILGADILDAIAIDYLYNRFPELNASQLTDWKNILVAKDIFPKDFKAKLGSQYLELGSNFSRTRDWLVDNFIKITVEELVEETENQLE